MAFKVAAGLFTMALGIMLGGCVASFEPRLNTAALDPLLLPTVQAARNGIEVSIEEYFSSHKSRRAFDADLGASRILPLLMHIRNNSDRDYRLERRRIEARRQEEPLVPLPGIVAAESGAARNPLWPALVNTAAIGPLAIFFGVGTLAGSATHTEKINRQIERHFERIELGDRVLKAQESAVGFVFFQLPSSAAQAIVDGVSVEISLEPEARGDRASAAVVHRLALPPLSRNFDLRETVR